MKAYNAEDLKTFTAGLFTGDVFDGFLLQEAEFTTCCSFSVDGKACREWFEDETPEQEHTEEYCSWKDIRPFCFGLIRGKRKPVRFRIVLRCSPEQAERFIKEEELPVSISDIGGLFLNIRYESGKLVCISMASMNTFTADRTLENAWDRNAEKFFLSGRIAVSAE